MDENSHFSVFGLVILNLVVFFLWKSVRMVPFMSRYFVCKFEPSTCLLTDKIELILIHIFAPFRIISLSPNGSLKFQSFVGTPSHGKHVPSICSFITGNFFFWEGTLLCPLPELRFVRAPITKQQAEISLYIQICSFAGVFATFAHYACKIVFPSVVMPFLGAVWPLCFAPFTLYSVPPFLRLLLFPAVRCNSGCFSCQFDTAI